MVRRALFVLTVVALALAAYFVGRGSRRPSEGAVGSGAVDGAVDGADAGRR